MEVIVGKRGFILTCLIVLLAFGEAKTQQYIFETIGYEQGLPDENLLCVFRDQEGLIWFGGGSGLFCYDGYEFKSFRHVPGNENSLSSNTVWDIAEDSQRRLWLATSSGLCIMNKERSQFSTMRHTETGDTIVRKRVHRVLRYKEEMYAAVIGVGVIRFEGNLTGRRLGGDELTGVYDYGELYMSDVEGRRIIYTSSDDNLIEVLVEENKIILHETPSEEIFGPTNVFSVAIPDPIDRDLVWCAIRPLGMMKYRKSTAEWNKVNFQFDIKNSLPPAHIRDFFFVDDERIMAYCEHGLFTFNPTSFQAYNDYENSQSEYAAAPALEWTNRMFRDQEGFVWITTGKGVMKMNPASQYIHYYRELLEYSITHLNSMGDSLLFASAYKEGEVADLLCYNVRTREKEHFSMPKNVLVPNGVYAIEPYNNQIWVCHTKGFEMFDISRKRWVDFAPALTQFFRGDEYLMDFEFIRDIAHVGDQIYFSTLKTGLYIYDFKTDSVTPVGHHAASELQLITRFKNDLWLSGPHLSPVKMIYCFHLTTGTAETIDLSEPLEQYNIEARQTLIQCTSDGSLYIGTQSNGLLRYSPYSVLGNRNLTLIDGRRGLHDGYIFTASADTSGNLWLGGRNGIYKVTSEGSVLNYGPREGLFNNVVNRITYLKSLNRVYADYPQVFVDVDNNFTLPRQLTLHIDRFQIVGSSEFVGIESIIKMPHNHNAFSVHYAALDYFHAHHIRYRYKLEGMDVDWIDAGSSRVINYAGVPPGDYVLVIEAWDETNMERRGSARMEINVIPAYYQTLWFKILMALLAGAAVFAITSFYRNQRLKVRMAQVAKEREMNAMRARISHDIHDEIGAGLTLISLRGQSTLRKMEGNPEAVKGNMEKVIHGAQDLTKSLGEIVWSVNPKHDNVSSFVAFVRNYINEFLEDSDISYSMLESLQDDSLVLTPELRRNLFLIVKESINNAVKHGSAKNITVRLDFKDENFVVSVEDDGDGFDVREQFQIGNGTGGNGLQGMRDRAEKVNASFDIFTAKGHGTRIVVRGSL
jgi:signal transduction histidine kinase/ligand-binding sensor domain-containing protein